eukprot:gnl/TRDRNA2_/TRDRNA2_166637_c0_seq5.p1 gnl/TRDRNA2_/TRDRNA2_166637_c0~~gnl/TRDRNA2_/TRDRNA2_166637_c0_seq5.p1  ORF type:complete len:141 (+),score=22.30 gnl/TRDRNA2_/TRDRNA2_166637_c0_seq5:130-552(+)
MRIYYFVVIALVLVATDASKNLPRAGSFYTGALTITRDTAPEGERQERMILIDVIFVTDFAGKWRANQDEDMSEQWFEASTGGNRVKMWDEKTVLDGECDENGFISGNLTHDGINGTGSFVLLPSNNEPEEPLKVKKTEL